MNNCSNCVHSFSYGHPLVIQCSSLAVARDSGLELPEACKAVYTKDFSCIHHELKQPPPYFVGTDPHSDDAFHYSMCYPS
jgi:hypothetical protein